MKARHGSFDPEHEQHPQAQQGEPEEASAVTQDPATSIQGPNGFYREIGDAIREARQRAGLSRAQAARQCRVSPFVIQSVEAGTVSHLDPYLPLLAALCSADTQQDG